MKKDYGTVSIPESWDEVTLFQYMGLQKLLMNSEDGTMNKYEVLSVMTDRAMDDILSFPMVIVDRLMSKLVFLNEAPRYEIRNVAVIDGKEYCINYMEQMTVREYNDIEVITRNDPNNIAAYLAVMLRPKTGFSEHEGRVWETNEPYTLEYSNQKFDAMVDKYMRTPITSLLPVIGFFLVRGSESTTLSQTCLDTLKHQLEECVNDTIASVKATGLKRWSMMRQMTALKKLKKSLQEI